MPQSHPPLVLASSSPARKRLLARLGVEVVALDHRVDETALAAPEPADLPGLLAHAKAQSLRAEHPDALILGSDQVVIFEGAILGQPGSEEGARAQLATLAGRTHELVTAVCLLRPDGVRQDHTDVHRMTMRALSEAEIRRYVDRDKPLHACGSYHIEEAGIALFEAIEGEDFTAIEGLPLLATAAMLRREGFAIP